MGPCVSVWVLICLWLTSYGYLFAPPHSENCSYAFAQNTLDFGSDSVLGPQNITCSPFVCVRDFIPSIFVC